MEYLTFPALEDSHQKTYDAKIVHGGVDLLERLLRGWKVLNNSTWEVIPLPLNPSSTGGDHSSSTLGLHSIAELTESTAERNITELGFKKYTVQRKRDLK